MLILVKFKNILKFYKFVQKECGQTVNNLSNIVNYLWISDVWPVYKLWISCELLVDKFLVYCQRRGGRWTRGPRYIICSDRTFLLIFKGLPDLKSALIMISLGKFVKFVKYIGAKSYQK
jgi:hypothetical protein